MVPLIAFISVLESEPEFKSELFFGFGSSKNIRILSDSAPQHWYDEQLEEGTGTYLDICQEEKFPLSVPFSPVPFPLSIAPTARVSHFLKYDFCYSAHIPYLTT
jgi:hypothetical protein